MKIVWFICINTAIGMIVHIIASFILAWICKKKYGGETIDEVLDDRRKESDTELSGITDHPERLRAGVTIFMFILWEFFIPLYHYNMYKGVKELHMLRKKAREVSQTNQSLK